MPAAPIVPELMQNEMTGESIAREARRLLDDGSARAGMKAGLAEVAGRLGSGQAARPAATAADIIQEILEGQVAHVS